MNDALPDFARASPVDTGSHRTSAFNEKLLKKLDDLAQAVSELRVGGEMGVANVNGGRGVGGAVRTVEQRGVVS